MLNLKSEWGGSKLPGLQVNNPKGTGKKTENHEVVELTGGDQGEKRIVSDPGDPDSTEQGNSKRRRMTSPDRRKQNIQWNRRPTFFTEQDKKEAMDQKP